MKGLICKDISLFANMGKTYLFILVIFTGLTVTGIYDETFLFMMLSVMLCMFPASAFSYDDLVKWDRFAVCAVDGRDKVVKAKYLFSLLLAGAVLALDLALSLLLTFVRKSDMPLSGLLFLSLGCVAATLILNALLLPLLYRFGAQKARIALVGVTAVVAGGCGALFAIGGLTAFGNGALPGYLGLFLPLSALVLFYISYRVSLSVYRKKDF